MLRVAIIGCGKIADSHAAQIQRITGCEMVAACDRELLMAEQLCDRFPVKAAFDDVSQMLERARPDVVHITTPPASHYSLGRQCLEAGAHVYMEKPFTVTADETQRLLALADSLGRRMTAGHDLQFSHAMRRTRALIRDGYIGGSPVHMESYYCYDLGDPRYAKALLSDKSHWIRQLHGKLLHNIISHGIARIAEHMSGDVAVVRAVGRVSKTLRDLGEDDIFDELRVIIEAQDGATAYFTFSSQMQPSLNQFRVFGKRNGIMMDEDNQTVVTLRGSRYKSYAEKFIPPLIMAREYKRCFWRNLGCFLGRDFHMKAGMKCLIEGFYRSIAMGGTPPISNREILLVSRIMEDIFRQTEQARTGRVSL